MLFLYRINMYFVINRIPLSLLTGTFRTICPTAFVTRSKFEQICRFSQFIVAHDIDTKEKLKTRLKCNHDESAQIVQFLTKDAHNKTDCLANLAYLYGKGASVSMITKNLHLLNIPKGTPTLLSKLISKAPIIAYLQKYPILLQSRCIKFQYGET